MKSNAKRITANFLAIILVLTTAFSVAVIPSSALSYSGSSSYKSGKYYTALTNVKLTGNQRTDIVNVAKSQVGYQEGGSSSQLSGTVKGNGNYTEYGRWYGMQDMWCAMFVSWCANVAGISTSIVPSHSYTPTGLNWFINKGRAYKRSTVAAGSYKPKAGDIIYFKSPRNSNITNHIGIVTKYSGTTVYTVEGNTSSATVSTNGGAVAAKSYDISNTYIVYICSPAYKNTSTASTEGTAPIISDGALDVGTGFYSNITNVNADLNLSIYESTNVIIYPKSTSDAQLWLFERQSDNSYKITNKKYGECLNVQGGGTASGTNVGIATDDDTSAQRWYIYLTSKGYVLKPKCATSCALSVEAGLTDTQSNVQIDTYDSSIPQIFAIPNAVVSTTATESTEASTVATQPSTAGTTATEPVATTSPTAPSTPATDKPLATLTDKGYVNGWVQENDNWSYYDATGTKRTGWVELDGEKYYFNSNGVMQTGLITLDNGQYYFNKSGAMQTGAFIIEHKVYYFDNDGTNTAQYKLGDTNLDNTIDINDSTCIQKYIADLDTFSATQTVIGDFDENGVLNIKDATQIQRYIAGYIDDNSEVLADIGTDFYSKITNINSGHNLSINQGTDIIIYTSSTSDAQQWLFLRQTDGTYKITNKKYSNCMNVTDGASASGTNVDIQADNGSTAQRWKIIKSGNGYVFKPVCAEGCALSVAGDSKDSGAEVIISTYADTPSQIFSIPGIGTTNPDNLTVPPEKMEVIRKIIYAVETGGQVYGNADYTDFTEAYTNSSEEHAITIGAGQWYATEAKTLLNLIRSTDPTLFASLDTQGIATDLDTKDWSTYKLTKTSAKAKCIQSIIGTDVGRACQDQLIDEQMLTYIRYAARLGVTDLDAQMMCANMRHQGGTGAVTRVLGKTATPYTLDNIYAALQTDTGNQVGAYKSRQKMVYNALKTYL